MCEGNEVSSAAPHLCERGHERHDGKERQSSSHRQPATARPSQRRGTLQRQIQRRVHVFLMKTTVFKSLWFKTERKKKVSFLYILL